LSLLTGTKLGPYEIVSLLGAGGMGEVYRARDARLGREVALKILSEDFGRDPERVRRFEIEARSASALSDPHVVTVYDVGEQGGVHYLATELVEGSDLRTKLDAGPLRTSAALEIGVQIAEGLSAAHERGIVHRDLKPENILITKAGVAKIADFGLAKQTGATTEVSRLVTAAENSTGTGVVMGTVAYMSPEQARGSKVDLRSDQFSFGLILYEMLTGRGAFRRDNPADTLSAILRDEPTPLRDVARDVPEPFARLVHRCLSKEPANRYASTRDLFHDLKALQQAPAESLSAGPGPRRSRPARLVAAALGVAAVAVAAFLVRRQARPASTAIDSLAILPFANSSGKADMEFLSDGITESLINKVSQVSGLRVISRTSAFHYKGREINPERVAKELNVRALLTGHVLSVGDSLEVGAELVDAQDGRHLWGEQYSRKMADIFSMQTEIAAEIATALRGPLTGQEQGRIEKRPTQSVPAYEAYLKGKYFFGRTNPGDLEKARAAFEEAVSLDPAFALAHVGISGCYGFEASMGYLDPAEAWPKSREHAERAIALDDSLPEGHGALAAVLLNRDWNWAAAEKELKRAMALGPVDLSLAEPNDLYSFYLAAMGRGDDAIAAEKKAQKTDPLSPLLTADLAQDYYYNRNFDAAIREARRALELQPDSVFGLTTLGLSLVMEGKPETGIASLRSGVDLSGGASFTLGNLGWAYGRSGRLAEARDVRKRLNALSRERYAAPLDRAMIEIGMGDADAAFAELDRAIAERNAWVIFLNVEPMFDPIRADPRFAKVVARVGLPAGKKP